MRAELVESEVVLRYPIRGILTGCCASALAPHTVSAATIAKSPAHFGLRGRFWILRPSSEPALSLSKGQVLHFRLRGRLSKQESKTRFEEVSFMRLIPSIKISPADEEPKFLW